jgi:hypothetical protein
LAFLLDLGFGAVNIPIHEVMNILLGQEAEKTTPGISNYLVDLTLYSIF